MTYRIEKKELISFFLLLPFFVPEGMSTIGAERYITNAHFLNNSIVIGITVFLYRFRNLLGIFVLLASFFGIIKNRLLNISRLKENYTISVGFFTFVLWLLLISKINNVQMYNLLVLVCFCTGYLLLIEKMIRQNAKQTIKILVLIFRMLEMFNLSLMILFPRGITTGMDYLSTPYYFLGTKNQVTPFLILALMLEAIWLNYDGKNKLKKFIFGVMLVFANAMGMGSSTSILTCVIMVAGITTIRKNQFVLGTRKFLNGKTVIGGVVFISIGIVFFDLQNIFKWLIVDILNKDLSLSGRTVTWEMAIDQIKRNPLIGYGYGYKVTENYYAHNAILELLATAGMGGLILYLHMCWNAIKQIDVKRKNAINVIVIVSMVSLILANTTEAFLYNISQLTIIVLVCHWRWLKLSSEAQSVSDIKIERTYNKSNQ